VDSTPLLPLPGPVAARLLVLEQLDAATEAHHRWHDGGDPEQLHRLRVALRRARSLFRAYAPHLEGARPRRARRRLGGLARATGESRDRWVQEEVLRSLSGVPEVVLERVASRLRKARQEGDRRARTALEEHLSEEVARIRKRLGTVTLRVDPGDPPAPLPSFAVVAAALLRSQGEELREALERIEGWDEAPVHRARIAGKRLRYLLEPLRRERPAAEELVKELRTLQDLLGEVRDLGLLEGEVARWEGAADGVPPGELRRLGRRLRTRGERVRRRVEEEWGEVRREAFFRGIQGLAGRLTAGGGGSGVGVPPTGGSPPPSGLEVERKFLLRRFPRLPLGAPRVLIHQGWLPGEVLQERLRRVRREDGTERFLRTVKSGRGMVRLELEEETTPELFRRLWPLTKGRRVRKWRYTVEEGGVRWEVDRFRDRKLVLAEVEFPEASAGEPPELSLPSWLARVVVREVTGEDAYVNLKLAK